MHIREYRIRLQADNPKLAEIFERRQVTLAYLFGSQATGQAGPLSDVDIAVLLPPGTPASRWSAIQLALTNDLIDLLGCNQVDVVVLNRAPPLLADRVVRYGQVLFESDPLQRVRFETETLRRYLDTKPLRKLLWTYLERQIQQRRAHKEAA
ncbi:MAG TPA: nucleotidyltransferase domain-containing protein [Anaerolineae bacterium]|nr:nucleotidyltransferase domain-containing protein [Anaerolineae bacterium]